MASGELSPLSRVLGPKLGNGSIGSTTEGSWSPSATFRRPRPKNATTPCWKLRPWPHNLNQMASGNPGAVQIADSCGPDFTCSAKALKMTRHGHAEGAG